MTDPSEWAATYLPNPTHAYRTSTSFHKRWPKFMGIRTDDVWRWSCWFRDTSNFHKNWSEPMQIVWKRIGDRLGGIYRSTKKSSTILPGQASATLWRTMLDRWRPPAADLAPWPDSSIRRRPLKLHMSNTRSHSSSNSSSNNSSRNSIRTRLPKAANEATSHPSPRQPTPPAANPANRNRRGTANQVVEDNHQAYRQHHGSQRKSLKADVLPANAYYADLRTTRRASALHTHEEVTQHSRTRD